MHPTRGLHEFPSLQSVLPDPYPLLSMYRQLGDVVYSPVEKAWVVTSHAAVIDLLRATSEFSNHSNGIERILQGADGAEHLNTRRAVNNGFSQEILERIEPVLREVARTCILNARSRGSAESIAQLAQPMPTRVFSELTGATEVAGQRLLEWGGAISSHGRLISPSKSLSVKAKRMMARAVRRVSDPTYREFLEAKNLIASLLRNAGSGGRSAPIIISLRELVDSKAVQLEDAIGVGLEFVFASTETTMGLIGFMLKRLCEDPPLLGHLKVHSEIRDAFIEEVLRYDAPVMKLNRRVKQSTSLCGQVLAAGDRAFAVIAAANRDPRVFDRPDDFEVDRAPNRHLAFGMGPHACPGARLARLEARVFLDEFLNLIERVTIDPMKTSVMYRGLGVTRSISEMHIVLS